MGTLLSGLSGRLKNKVAVLTGGAGGIGQVIAKRYLEEGATLVLTGRTLSKLENTKTELSAVDAQWGERIFCVAMDGSNPASLAAGSEQIQKLVGHVDVLINNAGSAGPRQELANIPLDNEDLVRLRASGSADTETLRDAVGSLLGSPWFTTKALMPVLAHAASVINVSTIFSRTNYYGRTAYVVPKAALNELTRQMAREFGLDARAIRVNTVYPGPVESERIHSVFSTMDKLKRVPDGTTRGDVVGAMLLQHSPTGNNYVSKEEVANTIVFLGSDESTGFTGQDFEVTHGLVPPTYRETHVISRPNLRVVDLEGRLVWIVVGDQVEDACELARNHHDMGADVFLTFRDAFALERARAELNGPGYTLELFDPLVAADWQKADTLLYLKHQLPRSTIVLPMYSAEKAIEHYGVDTLTSSFEGIQNFFDRELCGSITIAQRLDQMFNAADKRLAFDPVVVFCGNASNFQHNVLAAVRRAAMEQLIRTWRHENELMVQAGRRTRKISINQLVRYENEQPVNLELAAEWVVSLSNGLRRVRAIDIVLAKDLSATIQKGLSLNWERQALRGLHLRKVALITGGSEGIGGEAARLLAISGARVAIAARSSEKLEKARRNIIEELKLAGYSEPESRVLIIPDCDVADPKALQTMVDQTLVRFGRIDYLINNAGISGAEQMVADLPTADWVNTLQSNLISNYDLMLRVLPQMKKQKSGHILNVSSHFGGVRHATVAYPNRADYAVSKAGQRALAESLAAFLGPDVQINAVAPGPVDGIRLRGTKDKPGLYKRRAKLIQENKRMNAVYADLVKAARLGGDVAQMLQESPPVLTTALVSRLLGRLGRGGYFSKEFSRDKYLANFKPAVEPFLSAEEIATDAAKIERDVIQTLALKSMPSENDVGREMIFYLANRNVTGETLHPSGGLILEKLTMSGEMIGRVHSEMLAGFAGQHVVMVGGSMFDEMAELGAAFDAAGVHQIAFGVPSQIAREHLVAELKKRGLEGLLCVVDENSETLLDSVIEASGSGFKPNAVLSFGLAPMPERWQGLPTTEEFSTIVQTQLTNHLQVVRRASLIDDCRIIFITPRLPQKPSPIAFAMASFVRTTLRPLTVTAAQEGSRLVHRPLVHQIDVLSENRARLVDAVLLMAMPEPRVASASVHTDASTNVPVPKQSYATTITI